MSNHYSSYPSASGAPAPGGEQKSMILAVILALFIGSLGIHNFYLGKTGRGITQLILSVIGWLTTFLYIGYIPLTIVFIWVVIEIIQMLVNKNYRDGHGIPLKR